MVKRQAIVMRQSHDKADLIRFCASPDGVVMPDLKGRLPGRGAWVELSRQAVEQAVRRKIFARALKQDVLVPADLPERVDALLMQAALGSLSLARRGGGIVTGANQVEAMVRRGRVVMVLHALEAAEDGRRKISQAVFVAQKQGLGDVVVETIFNESQLATAFAGNHVIHAAIMKGVAATGLIEKLRRLKLYREQSAEMIPDTRPLPEVVVSSQETTNHS